MKAETHWETSPVFRWNLKDLDIKTKSVQKTLEPLLMQVTTLVNTQGTTSKKKKGKSKRAHVLVAAVEAATAHFIEKGKEIVRDSPEISDQMNEAIADVHKSGAAMSMHSREFAEDPCSSMKRSSMVKAARQLLSAVTRLLILADMVDVHLLFNSLEDVELELEKVRNASSNNELMDAFRRFSLSLNNLLDHTARRQQEMMDPRLQDDLAAARATLNRSTTMLLTTSKAYIRHPELSAARANRDYVLAQVCQAIDIIKNGAQGELSSRSTAPLERAGELESALDSFDAQVVIDPLHFNEAYSRALLEDQLESIISGSALMADSSSTRSDRRHRIIEECDALRSALQDLLQEYMDNMENKEPSESLNQALGHIHTKTRDLRRHLRKSVVDHVSDKFIDTMLPLMALIEAAENGNPEEVEEKAEVFGCYAEKIVEVSNLACSLSSSEDGVKMVRYAGMQIEQLYPQVINAAKVLAVRHTSKVAQNNLEAFKDAWETQLRILIESVDEISTIDDFLAVSETHILEDVKICLEALKEGDMNAFDRGSRAIVGRSARVCDVVTTEMDDYEPCSYTDKVLDVVKNLSYKALPNFKEHVEKIANALGSDSAKDIDDNEFIDASYLVHDCVREIRMAVMMNKADDELDPDEIRVGMQPLQDWRSSMLMASEGISAVDEYPDVSGISTASDAMLNLSEKDKNKIADEVKNFEVEKEKFDKEILKWDDSSNDIIALAKTICVIMIHMTDFTRGRGPLKTTMDVISAAKKISALGMNLDKLARDIANKCPDSTTKNDLLAYLDRISLYCHQLNITSNVKADVTSISGNLIVSGLDSATSLIQAAKNLMNGVVSAVRCAYTASTIYKRTTNSSGIGGIVWKMKAPEKKPLVRMEKSEVKARMRRGSVKRHISVARFFKELETVEDRIAEEGEEEMV